MTILPRRLSVTDQRSAGSTSKSTARAPKYVPPRPIRSHADRQFAERIEAHFAAKNSQSPDDTMAFFSKDMSSYGDATLAWEIAGYDAEKALYVQYMP